MGRGLMRQRIIVVVSGPVAGGKSVLARALAERFDGIRMSTRDLLMPRLGPGEIAEPVVPSTRRLETRRRNRWTMGGRPTLS